ncbi:MAG: Branched-chain amino acid transporter permease, partial [Deltaproteobacteria bacterium]|nr:Branched-chain amino acid transporter permease [Deltaproteobacteria bacterium]
MLSYILIPAWFVLLTLPFLGISGSLKLGAALLICTVFVRVADTQRIAYLLNIWGNRIESFNNRAKKIDSRLSMGVILLILSLLPFTLNRYSIDIAIIAGIYIVLALGLNIVVGLA